MLLHKLAVLFFITNDCPISNSYAPEIARICSEYAAKGAACTLVYVDPSLTEEAAAKHAAQFGYGPIPRVVDRAHTLVKQTGVTITPEVAVLDEQKRVLYRGRIDNSFAALGQPRRKATSLDLRDALDATLAGKPAPHPETKTLGCYIPDLKLLK